MSVFQYPSSLGITAEDGGHTTNDSAANASYMEFKIYERKSSKDSVPLANIFLYMPTNLENPTSVQWDQGGVGLTGDVASKSGFTSNEYGSAAATSGGQSALLQAGRIARQAALLSDAEKAQNVQELQNGQIVNPYIRMLFRGLNFRTFSFDFKFTPHTLEESTEIKRIVNTFRRAALPDRSPNDYYMKYPHEVEIEYHYNGEKHPWLNKFKRCVITDLNVNYTSAGFYASMRDGFPAETQLTLTFTENELVWRKDVNIEGESF